MDTPHLTSAQLEVLQAFGAIQAEHDAFLDDLMLRTYFSQQHPNEPLPSTQRYAPILGKLLRHGFLEKIPTGDGWHWWQLSPQGRALVGLATTQND